MAMPELVPKISPVSNVFSIEGHLTFFYLSVAPFSRNSSQEYHGNAAHLSHWRHGFKMKNTTLGLLLTTLILSVPAGLSAEKANSRISAVTVRVPKLANSIAGLGFESQSPPV